MCWAAVQTVALFTGCAQISAPTGGPRDSLAPVLVNARPALKSLNVTDNKITLNFNEYVEVKDALTNVLVSPLPKNNPVIDYKLRTVTVKLKDTLQPNTTYSVNFGNAIVDVNEGNVFKDFTYVFSTGSSIDSFTCGGSVTLAENAKADSTLLVMLYRNATDSAVQKVKPDYITRLRGDGSFNFTSLPGGSFHIYALKDADGGKTYNVKTELFAFADKPVIIGPADTPNITLYAFAEEKDNRGNKAETGTAAAEKKLRYTAAVTTGPQDLLDSLTIEFNKPLTKLEANAIQLTDTNLVPVPGVLVKADSTAKKIFIKYKWPEATAYRLLINKTGLADSTGLQLGRSDTIAFKTQREADYGNLVLRFSNLDLAKKPVLLFVLNDAVTASYAVTATEWSQKLFKPGEYEVRILYDTNNNGIWDPGNYTKKRQPEKVTVLPQKIAIRANWDNERDIKL